MLSDNLPFIAVKEVNHVWYVELPGPVDLAMRILHITMCQDVVTFGIIGEYPKAKSHRRNIEQIHALVEIAFFITPEELEECPLIPYTAIRSNNDGFRSTNS